MVIIINVVSILQRLRNKAKQENMSFQLALQLFSQEEFLRRLSKSIYKNELILKGGLFLYLISDFKSRPTMDIDFLIETPSNEMTEIELMIESILKIETGNDFIVFEIRSIETISEHRANSGVRVKMLSKIANTRTPFDIDIGVGDVVVPKPTVIEFEPLLKEFSNPKILSYSLESTIAEKWDAIVDRMELTSRMKDFYDIYYLASNYNFEGIKLQKSIFETMTNRERTFDENTIKNVSLIGKDADFMNRWKAFTQDALKNELDYFGVIKVIINFIGEPFEGILKKEEFHLVWSKEKMLWK